ncbi:MAG: YafY family protein [Gammaproteobacteria bacterium]|nr:YafY family protein [Gammaproteobacteria bacterium]MXW47017.1 YafY family transcriptional regulator [Gammaproteobacteria bacterium]MYD02908.1 YafY family transcriptional regulator [Gammaproteobacteria bacterium]MYI24485.1 YafY family transcriptional regulator [Gammaproteobacteria bacterium]
MRQFDRAYRLYQAIRARRYPVGLAVLREELECSASTAKRAIRDLRTLGAPLEYDPEQRGYYFDDRGGSPWELPGLWFNEQELLALLVMDDTLREISSRLLESSLAPLRERVAKLLAAGAPGAKDLRRRVRLPAIGARRVDAGVFGAVSSALVRRRRLQVIYNARSNSQRSERSLSPQRLVLYRSNWYLDAWCHIRRGLRSFSLDRMQDCELLDSVAREVDDAELDRVMGGSYGIFSGEPRHRARIRFSRAAAEWVAAEQWHPDQRGTMRDSHYELEIPYNNPTELVMDILRHGPEAEVLDPPELRELVAARLDAAAKKYV